MKPRQDLSNTDDMGPYVAPPKRIPIRSVKRTGGGFADPSTLDAQRARVAVSAAVSSGVVDSPKKLEEDETFQELGKIIDSNIKNLLSECKKRDGEKNQLKANLVLTVSQRRLSFFKSELYFVHIFRDNLEIISK